MPQLNKNSASRIDSLLLKTGKAGFDVLQMIVHGQIREWVKEFKSGGT